MNTACKRHAFKSRNLINGGNLNERTNCGITELPMLDQITLFSGRDTPDTFKKAVQVVHSMPLSALSLLQRKMLNSWLKFAAVSEPDEGGWWELRLDAMESEIDFNSKNRPYLKESAENLMRIVFQWDVIAPESKRVKWKASVLFPDVEILSEVVRFKISDQLKEQVLSPEMYAWIDQGVLRKYRRAASIGIYEFCMRYSRLGKTATVEWQKFRDMILGASADLVTYREYKYFKSKVLLCGIEEINAEGALNLELHEVRKGRFVAGVYFTVQIPKAFKDIPELSEESVDLVAELQRLGIPPSESKRLVQENTGLDLNVALAFTNERKANKKAEKLVNSAAYFRKALNEKWRPQQTENNEVSDVEVKEPEKQRISKPDFHAMFRLHQMREVEVYFSKLDTEDQGLFIERYNTQQKIGALVVKPKPTRASKVAFQQWLIRDLWGEADAAQILAFGEKLLAEQSALLTGTSPVSV